MALGPSSYLVGKWFDATFRATSFSVATVYLKLHTGGEPGAAGTSNPSTHTTRYAVVMASAASTAGGVTTISNTTALTISSITATGSEDSSHYSLWDASSGGNFLGSGIIGANAYVGGDTLNFAIGAISIALNVAA